MPIQLMLRLVRPLLRQVEQADGEIGQPVLQVAEGLFSSAGGAQDLDIVSFGAQRLGVLLEFAAKVEAGARQNQQEDRRQQHQPGGDREAGYSRSQRKPGRLGGHHPLVRNKVMLMTPPRSPSLAPSFG